MAANNSSNNQNNSNNQSSSNNANGGNGSSSVSWQAKVGYIGTGIVIGIAVYPFVRKHLAKFQPNMDKALDILTGKAEGLAESAADLLAHAKQSVKSVRKKSSTSDRDEQAHSHEQHNHRGDHDHHSDHDHHNHK